MRRSVSRTAAHYFAVYGFEASFRLWSASAAAVRQANADGLDRARVCDPYTRAALDILAIKCPRGRNRHLVDPRTNEHLG